MRKTIAGLWFVLAGAGAAGGQTPRRAHEIPSTGQPPLLETYIVPAGVRAGNNVWRTGLTAGVHRAITNPVVGLFGVTGELYGTTDPGIRPGARVLATSRLLGLSAGADWDGRSNRLDGIVSLQTSRVPADAEMALNAVRSGATSLLAYTNLYPERSGGLNYGPSYSAVIRAYGDGLMEAFRIAAGNQVVGDRVTRRARMGLLDQVLIPYDSLFGRVKEDAGSIRPLTSWAQASFVAWLRDSSRLSSASQPAIAAVHARWLGVIEQMHRDLLRQWRDSRLVWLPLQLALDEADYDEQAEVDSLIGRAVGRPFTDQNALTYLKSADLPLEIARSIFAARDYHVLWTHDFAGNRPDTRTLDEVSLGMVADAYLPALTAAVQRYDSTRVLPVYMLLIDQFFYEMPDGRLWLDILEAIIPPPKGIWRRLGRTARLAL